MQNHLKVAEYLTKIMDEQFSFLGLKFGLDPILGIIPWFGDAIAAIVSLYMVWIAIQAKLPSQKISQMIANIITDFILGLIPVIGDVADFTYKANSKNLRILKEHIPVHIYEGKIASV